MQRRIRASLVAAVATALVLAAPLACSKKPVESSVGSTDTTQSAQTTGTTATETGGGPPVTATTTSTTATSTASATGTH